MDGFLLTLGLVLAAAVLCLLVRQAGEPVLALVLGLAVGVLLWLRLLPELGQVCAAFAGLAEQAGLQPGYLAVLLKIILISYLAEFGAALCRDAGEGALAGRLELAGRVAVVALALPVVVELLTMVLSILP